MRSPSRPLTPNERAVIMRLLSVEFPEVEYFRAQVPAITVTGECDCGCGSIYLGVDPALARPAPSPAWHEEHPDLIVESGGGSWLLLFQKDGWLMELEYVPDTGPPPQLLDPETVLPDLQVDQDWFE